MKYGTFDTGKIKINIRLQIVYLPCLTGSEEIDDSSLVIL